MKISHKLNAIGWSLGAALLAATLGASPAFAQGENDLGGAAVGVTPQSGFWSDPSAVGGRSIAIEVVAATGEIFASTLVYDETGRAIWYVINTVPNSVNATGQLQKFVGGQSLNSNYRSGVYLESLGTATLTFSSPTTGTLTVPGGLMNIQRYDIVNAGSLTGPAAGAPGGGWWWNASESGRGFFIESQNGTMMIAALEYNDLGQATWYYSRGSMTNATMYTGTLFEPYGGQTISGGFAQATQNYNRGTITVQFTSTTTALVTEPSGRQTTVNRYGF